MAILDRAFGRPQTTWPDPGRPQASVPVRAPAWGQSLRLRPALLVAGVAIVILGLIRVVQTSDATSTGFAIQRLEQERLDWQTRVHQLEAEAASLSSLARIEQEARSRLGLAPSERREHVQVNVEVPEQPLLPTRFSPDTEPGVDERGSAWWQDLLKLLPFY